MITVFQLQRELAKVIEAGNGNAEVRSDEKAITGLYYRNGEEQTFEAAHAEFVALETGGSQ